MTTATLFERLGGEEAIVAAVDLFYDKIRLDPRIARFFEGMDMDNLTTKQVSLMAWAFGAPTEYRGKSLREAHAKLLERGLNDSHFDAVAEHLQSTLIELGIEPSLVAEALAIVATTRTDVLGR